MSITGVFTLFIHPQEDADSQLCGLRFGIEICIFIHQQKYGGLRSNHCETNPKDLPHIILFIRSSQNSIKVDSRLTLPLEDKYEAEVCLVYNVR